MYKECHIERIDDQHDVVAHEHRGEVLSRIFDEDARYAAEEVRLFAVYLQLEAVGGREGDLHSGEERRKKKSDYDYDRDRPHGFYIESRT